MSTVNVSLHNWRILEAAVKSENVTTLGVCVVVKEILDDPINPPRAPSEAYQQAARELGVHWNGEESRRTG